MQFDTVLFDKRDRIAYVTLNRPDRLNALNGAMIAICAPWRRRSRPIRTFAPCCSRRPAALSARERTSWAMICSKTPSSAAVKISAPGYWTISTPWFGPGTIYAYRSWSPSMGLLPGAGVSLALVGDIVLAARSATFLQLFAPKLGLMPDLGSTYHLPRLVGTARAKGLALLGDALSAADAANWGLIWACVEDGALLEQAESIARRFSNGPTQAYQRIKKVFSTLAEQLAVESDLQPNWAIPATSRKVSMRSAASAPRSSRANSASPARAGALYHACNRIERNGRRSELVNTLYGEAGLVVREWIRRTHRP